MEGTSIDTDTARPADAAGPLDPAGAVGACRAEDPDGPVAVLLGRLTAVADGLLAADVTGLSDFDVLESIHQLHRQCQRLYAGTVRLVAEMDHRDLATTGGATSVASLLGQVITDSPGDCAATARTAAAVHPKPQLTGTPTPAVLPRLAAALAAGEVSARHARIIVTTMTKIGKTSTAVGQDTRDMCEQVLVEQAAQLSPPALQKIADYLLQLADPDGSLDRDAYHRQEFHLGKRGDDGLTRVWGRLDDITIEALRQALDPLARPRPEPDTHTCTCPPDSHHADQDGEPGDAEQDYEPSDDDGPDGQDDDTDTNTDAEGPPAVTDDSRPDDDGAHPDDLTHPDHDRIINDQTDSDDSRTDDAAPDTDAQPVERTPRPGPDHPPTPPGDPACLIHRPRPAGFPPPPRHPDDPRLTHAADDALRDRRPAPLRNAHALYELLTRYLDVGASPTHGGEKPHLTVTVDYHTLKGQLGAALLSDGAPISAPQARMLACHADILPTIMGGPSAVLDMGRATRTFTPATRRAITARDRGCTFPGCDRPPHYTNAHHVTHWARGGPSDYHNGVLLCAHHHRIIHQEEWTIMFAADGTPEFQPPAHLDPDRTPRRNTLQHQLHQIAG